MNIGEEKSYNALALALQGEYRELEKCLKQHGSWREAWEQTRTPARLDPEREWERLASLGIRLILRDDKEFPAPLREIPWPPFGVYCKGAPWKEGEEMVAVVGTRKATLQGKRFAGKLAKDLARRGLTIISGLAFGIDAAAHAATLEARGRTVAVLGNGLDRIYPREHERLAREILETGGAIIAEYPLGSPSFPNRFLERNRLISGLARGVVVIEAPEGSGALATARFALEQNREVFVVPGPVEHPNYVGSHELVKAGAALTTSAQDIVLALGIAGGTSVNEGTPFAIGKLDENEKAVITILHAAGAPLGAQAIADRSRLEATEVGRTLSMLVIQGLVKDENGKFTIA